MNQLRPIDAYFLQKEEPIKSCLQFLREYIGKQSPNLTEAWKYGMPFFCYKGKMCCYLWVHKTLHQPYIGFVEGKRMDHPGLLQEKRARMKIFLINPAEDMPLTTLDELLRAMLALYC